MIESIKNERVVMMRSELEQFKRLAALEQLQDIERLLTLPETSKEGVRQIVTRRIIGIKRKMQGPRESS